MLAFNGVRSSWLTTASSAIQRELGNYNTFMRTANWPVSVAVISVFMILVGMLACLEPTRRAIRIRPMDALRS